MCQNENNYSKVLDNIQTGIEFKAVHNATGSVVVVVKQSADLFAVITKQIKGIRKYVFDKTYFLENYSVLNVENLITNKLEHHKKQKMLQGYNGLNNYHFNDTQYNCYSNYHPDKAFGVAEDDDLYHD